MRALYTAGFAKPAATLPSQKKRCIWQNSHIFQAFLAGKKSFHSRITMAQEEVLRSCRSSTV